MYKHHSQDVHYTCSESFGFPACAASPDGSVQAASLVSAAATPANGCTLYESNIFRPVRTSFSGNGDFARGLISAHAASSAATSAASSFQERAERLSFACLILRAPGMGVVALAMHQLIATCEGVAPCLSAVRLTVSTSRVATASSSSKKALARVARGPSGSFSLEYLPEGVR